MSSSSGRSDDCPIELALFISAILLGIRILIIRIRQIKMCSSVNKYTQCLFKAIVYGMSLLAYH